MSCSQIVEKKFKKAKKNILHLTLNNFKIICTLYVKLWKIWYMVSILAKVKTYCRIFTVFNRVKDMNDNENSSLKRNPVYHDWNEKHRQHFHSKKYDL